MVNNIRPKITLLPMLVILAVVLAAALAYIYATRIVVPEPAPISDNAVINENKTPSGRQTYRNDEYAFEFEYPAEFTQCDLTGSQDLERKEVYKLLARGADCSGSGEYDYNPNDILIVSEEIAIWKEFSDITTLRAALEKAMAAGDAGFTVGGLSYYIVNSVQEVNVDGIAALKVGIESFNLAENDVIYYFFRGGKLFGFLYNLDYSLANGGYESAQKEMEQIISTFKFDDSSNAPNEIISSSATAPVDYLGEYSYDKKYDKGPGDSGVLDVIEMSSGEITFNLSLANYQLHLGDIRGGKAKVNGNVAVYEHKDDFSDDVCRLEITFTGDSATIKTVGTKYGDASCGFGMNVFADGVYAKKIGSGPNDFAKFADYIPAGWQIKTKEEGDLNKDGIPDAVLVIEDAVEDKTTLDWRYCADGKCGCAQTQSCARKLMLFFGKKGGGYELSLGSDKAILLANEGGAFGDPLEGLEINNGSILLKFYGGSSWRWDNVYRFRYQDNGWYLVGKTKDNYHSSCPYEVFQSVDTNFLTGKTEIFTGTGWFGDGSWRDGFECDSSLKAEAGTSAWADNGPKELINLENFDPRNN